MIMVLLVKYINYAILYVIMAVIVVVMLLLVRFSGDDISLLKEGLRRPPRYCLWP